MVNRGHFEGIHVVQYAPSQEANSDNRIKTKRTIVIQIVWVPGQQNPMLKINQENVPWDDLEPALPRIFLSRAEKVAYVKAIMN